MNKAQNKQTKVRITTHLKSIRCCYTDLIGPDPDCTREGERMLEKVKRTNAKWYCQVFHETKYKDTCGRWY